MDDGKVFFSAQQDKTKTTISSSFGMYVKIHHWDKGKVSFLVK